MSPRVHRRGRIAILALLLGAVAVWLVPSYFSAERYRRLLEVGLERALRRRVTFGEVTIRLLPRPGFVIENAAIQEDPAFGSEPFVRVDRIECDIRWQTLLGSHLDFSHFRLEHANINLVRKTGEGWNLERFLLPSTGPSGAPGAGLPSAQITTGPLDLDVEDGRVNFKVGENKKAIAITDLRARLSFDPARGRLRFQVLGYPIRIDSSLPSPGAVEISGEWTPGRDLRGPLSAVVRTREALVYDWAPLVSGRNTGLYGVLDADLGITGTIRSPNFQGSGRLTELHRWDQIPPTEPMPWTITFRGQLDRDRGRLRLETAEASFANSHVQISGTIDYLSSSPELDLVLALERSRLQDLTALAVRLGTVKGSWGLNGRIDAMLSVQGPWADRRYGGFVGAHDVVLSMRSASFPISDVAVRIDNRGARLAPVRITLAPHVGLEAEGSIDLGSMPLHYELTLSSKALPLRDVLQFGRALGIRALQGWNGAGSGVASFHLAGALPLPNRPVLKGRAELRGARLVIPGFNEPINVPRASVQVNGDDIIVDHFLGVLGTSVLSGRFEHQGDSVGPWTFDLHADNLNLGQGALWFVALGHRKPVSLLQRLPGLDSYTAEREAAARLFASLNARGKFAASKVTYRGITLDNFRTNAEVVGRVIQLSDAAFRVGGGQGRLKGRVDLAASPVRLAADLALSGVGVQSIAGHLPPVLREAHGSMSVSGHFETTGLTQEETLANLEGNVKVVTGDLSLVSFDPVGAYVQLAGAGTLEPLRSPAAIHPLTLNLQIHDRRVVLKKTTLEFSGARLSLSGAQAFDGSANFHFAADLQHLRRRWLTRADEVDPEAPPRELDFSGPLDKLAPISHTEVSRARDLRSK